MKQRPSILRSIVQFVVLSVCHAQDSWMITVAVGQDVRIPCGVQVQGTFERLVWNLRDGNSTDQLAFSYAGARSCKTQKKENCYLRSDGSLELQNVQETDSDDYFCAVDIEEKYYSQHTLVVQPEVAFETCPNSMDVSGTQTGPDEIVLAYTNPVCKNTDVTGIVTCDPPPGAKIGMNVTEIVCNCIHSGNVVDTCETSIPDVFHFKNYSGSDSVCGSKAVTIVCAPFTASGIFLGIFIGAILGGVGNLIQYFYIKHRQKQSSDKQKNAELKDMLKKTVSTESNERCTPQRYTDGNKESTVIVPPSDDNGTLAEVCSDVTGMGLPCTNPNESGINTAVATPDTQDSIPCCTEIRQLVVEDISEKFTILPSRTNPTGGIAVSCYRDENLTVGFHTGDLSTFPNLTLDPLNGGMTISVSDKVAVPLHINCLDCGISVCTLEVNGSEWSKEEPETDCTTTYQCI